jgi:hypothetical protein
MQNLRNLFLQIYNIPLVFNQASIFEFFYQLEGADVGFDPEFKLFEADKPRVRAKRS